MFRLRAPLRLGSFTGRFMLADFVNGEASVSKDYYRRVLIRYGCTDITTPEEAELMRKREFKRVLFIRYGAFGDNLIVTPAIHAFKQHHPDCTIHVYAKPPSDCVYYNSEDIEGILASRPTDLGFMIEDYDEVIDFTQSIEVNPEADWKNAIDIACDWAGFHPTDGDYRPKFKLTDKECMFAASVLAEHDIDAGKDKIVVIHGESSCALRSLPDKTTVDVAIELAKKGYKVVLPGLHDYSWGLHQQPDEIKKNIVSLRVEILHETIPARYILGVGVFAQVIIAVDSSWSHLAAALDKPSLLIYGAFDPALRALHFPKARVLFRAMPCGPCQTLGRFCARHPSEEAPCMQQYTSKEIVEMTEQIIEGKLEPHKLERISPLGEQTIRKCPICDGETVSPFTKKGAFFFVRCNRCQSIFTHRLPTKEELAIEGFEQYGPEVQHMLQYAFLAQQIGTGHKIEGRKLQVLAPYMIKRFVGKELSRVGWLQVEDEEPDLRVMLFHIEHLADPHEPFKAIADGDHGITFVYGPIADKCRENNFTPLNPPVCGTSNIFLSKLAVEYLCKKYGIEILRFEPIGDNALITMRKLKKDG